MDKEDLFLRNNIQSEHSMASPNAKSKCTKNFFLNKRPARSLF